MGKTTYKIGQLVYCSGGVLNRRELVQGFGNIVSITDRKTKELYSEKEVITGCGNKNTQVDIEVDVITKSSDLWEPASPIVLRDISTRLSYDPHNVILVEPEYFEKIYKKALDDMNHKLDFIKKHSVTRDDKINTILG